MRVTAFFITLEVLLSGPSIAAAACDASRAEVVYDVEEETIDGGAKRFYRCLEFRSEPCDDDSYAVSTRVVAVTTDPAELPAVCRKARSEEQGAEP